MSRIFPEHNAPFKIGPDERILMIRCSFRCLWYGAASAALTLGVPVAIYLVLNVEASVRWMIIVATGWLPLYSLTLSVFSWLNVFRAREAARGEWNPAATQILWGRLLSAFAVLISLIAIFFFVGVLLNIFPGSEE